MKVIYPDTFEATLSQAVDFLTRREARSPAEILALLENITQDFEQRMDDQPLSCQYCQEAQWLGRSDYREYHQDGYRVVYQVQDHAVYALLFLHQKQSLQKALVDHCLLLIPSPANP